MAQKKNENESIYVSFMMPHFYTTRFRHLELGGMRWRIHRYTQDIMRQH